MQQHRIIAVFVCGLLLACMQHVASGAGQKTILIVGISGVGKSTIANCLYNQNGDMKNINEGPFKVSPDASSGTIKFEVHSNTQFTVIDSIGFGSNEFNSAYVLDQMRTALNTVDNQIDCIVYVTEKGRLTNETYQFVRLFQEEVMNNKAKQNSMLLVNKCEPGWLAKEAQQKEPHIQHLLASVNHLAYEFDLLLDHESDDEAQTSRNKLLRQKSINDLVATLDAIRFSKININYIQTDGFKRLWTDVLFGLLNRVAEMIQQGITENKSPEQIGEMVFIEACRHAFKWAVRTLVVGAIV